MTEVHAEGAASAPARPRRGPAIAGPTSSRGEQLRSLGADHREIIVLGRGGILGGGELHHLAFGNDRGGGGEDVERLSEPTSTIIRNAWPSRKSPTSTLASIAPQHARRVLAAAQIALVDDVVMQQSRRVHELDAAASLTWPSPP